MLRIGRKLLSSVRERGIKRTAASVVCNLDNWVFDLTRGTGTATWVELDQLDFQSPNKSIGSPYVPCKSGPLRQLLKGLPVDSKRSFVDFGCGKGKALIIAAELGFEKLVGVEFSDQLCKCAGHNIDKLNPQLRSRIEILNIDASTFKFQGDEQILFFYDPFGPDVIKPILNNLKNSLILNPRSVWIVYYAPEHRSVFDDQEFLKLLDARVLGGADYLIYQSHI